MLYCKEHGYSQRQFGKLCGVSQGTISNWCRGNATKLYPCNEKKVRDVLGAAVPDVMEQKPVWTQTKDKLPQENGRYLVYILVFIKNFSPQVLKANMKIVGATEYALVLYRNKLPKFNNEGRMVFNWFEWRRDGKEYPKIHPTQKPVNLMKQLIALFTDPGDVVIDPCAGSGSTLRAAIELGRRGYGFEVSKPVYRLAKKQMLDGVSDQMSLF